MTVPSRPTNGETEPTEPRNAMPPCRRALASSSWRVRVMPIQSLRPTRVVPPCEALRPASAMPRNTEVLGSLSTPSFRVAEVQNFFSTWVAWPRMRCCSIHLVKKMYQVPADMMASTTRMALELQVPSVQMWPRLYWLGMGASEAAALAASEGAAAGPAASAAGAA